jgi:hypothetical protein
MPLKNSVPSQTKAPGLSKIRRALTAPAEAFSGVYFDARPGREVAFERAHEDGRESGCDGENDQEMSLKTKGRRA